MSVTVQFSGGLGNQLFQYAAGYALAQREGQPLIAETVDYYRDASRSPEGPLWRPFILKELDFPIKVRPLGPLWLLRRKGFPLIRRAILNFGIQQCYAEEGYTADFEKLSGNVLLQGLFQDRRYFQPVEKEFLELVERCLKAKNETHWQPLPADYGALHLRLGDYLKFPEIYHPQFFLDRASQVIRHMLEHSDVERVAVFSDSAEHLEAILKPFGARVYLAEANALYGGSPDLLTMATAKALAICNSTFSYWAGLLASSRGGSVIAPEVWTSTIPDPRKTLYPSEWMVM